MGVEGGLKAFESEEASLPPLRDRLNSFRLCLARDEEPISGEVMVIGSLLFLPIPMMLRRLPGR